MVDLSRVVVSVGLRDRMVATILGRYPRKSFGYLVSDAGSDRPTDFILFRDNIRNDAQWRPGFESWGRYFVEHPDAGFVATPEESWRVQQLLVRRGVAEVAMFHSHLRHPGNFSDIDYELHRRRFGSLWHMIISLRNPQLPQVRAFAVAEWGVRELEIDLTPDAVPVGAGDDS